MAILCGRAVAYVCACMATESSSTCAHLEVGTCAQVPPGLGPRDRVLGLGYRREGQAGHMARARASWQRRAATFFGRRASTGPSASPSTSPFPSPPLRPSRTTRHGVRPAPIDTAPAAVLPPVRARLPDLTDGPRQCTPAPSPPPPCRSAGRRPPSSSSRRVSCCPAACARIAAPCRAPLLRSVVALPADVVASRNRHLPGQGPNHLQHQCLSSCPGHDQAHAGPLRWRPAHGGREWQADHHQRRRHRHEGPSSRSAPRPSPLT